MFKYGQFLWMTKPECTSITIFEIQYLFGIWINIKNQSNSLWIEIEQMNGKNDSDWDDTYDYCAHDTFSWFMSLKIFIK